MARINRIKSLTVDYSASVEDRIALAQKSLPWIIAVHPKVIRDHQYGENDDYLSGVKEYRYRLFELPEGTSHRAVVRRMNCFGWSPADPAHMLAFAAGGFERMPGFPYGVWHHYVVGLGGTLHTVLGSQFGGLGTGTTWFFQHVPQDKPMHQGGVNTRFLAVKRNWT